VPKSKPLSESTKKTLKAKAEKSGLTYGELSKVYRRGQGAYLSSGSRNVPMAAWSMGRVNSYIRGDKARTADKDVYKSARSRSGRKK
jgi:hypothetical protein